MKTQIYLNRARFMERLTELTNRPKEQVVIFSGAYGGEAFGRYEPDYLRVQFETDTYLYVYQTEPNEVSMDTRVAIFENSSELQRHAEEQGFTVVLAKSVSA